jgi:Pyruvate/2-oxoacid:ferredoxin oxidoreductase delta subunit
MADQVYTKLMQRFARKNVRYPGMDIPEFYEMVSELFTPEQASVASSMPHGPTTAEQLAPTLATSVEEVERVLESMADDGLCISSSLDGAQIYVLPPFVPGIFEFQFMRGTRTEKDLKLARLIHRFKEAVDAVNGIPEISFPSTRVITVDQKIEVGHQVRTFDQMSAHLESADPIAVCTCYCRHEAQLLDESDTCGKPNDVCMSFGMGARYAIDRGMGREVSKQEALEIITRSEQAGLVHCSINRQNIDFVCNCCADHCIILQTALAQPKPGLALNSGFQPSISQEECTVCEQCIDDCPATALAMSEDDALVVDLDRCFGCGVCATVCPTEAIALIAKPGYPEPPVDAQALRQALKTGARAS